MIVILIILKKSVVVVVYSLKNNKMKLNNKRLNQKLIKIIYYTVSLWVIWVNKTIKYNKWIKLKNH